MDKTPNIEWTERSGIAVNARQHLPALVRDYFTRVRFLLAADPPPAELHPIRLASKRLRYSLELFRPCYGPGLKARIAELQRLQTVLGEVNDCSAAVRLIEDIAPVSATRARAEKFLRHRADAKAAELRKEWRETFDAPGREQWWLEYLANSAKTPKRHL